MPNPFASSASKRLGKLEAALKAAGIDPDSPDMATAIAARAPDLAAAAASAGKTKGEETAETKAGDPPECYDGEGDPVQDCADCPMAEECSNPNKTSKKENAPAAKEAVAFAKKWQAIASQAKAANIDLEAIAQDPEGLKKALATTGQEAVKKALGDNAPPTMEHTETVQASLHPWQTYQALKEAGKDAEASVYFKAHRTEILSEGFDNPENAADSTTLTIHS